uniref:Uncharacterized protein n=1 Tax=Noctiluca scintillans TaxID=2966 RepID=A0A7S0ZUG8_NOCSC|mmetsp:Transcript_19395/g.51763  ORF Transcript_19395/g.51763 Transcript_19395/m.51763 type:complete len:457 (+) Transcript_19395:62-1432(+)
MPRDSSRQSPKPKSWTADYGWQRAYDQRRPLVRRRLPLLVDREPKEKLWWDLTDWSDTSECGEPEIEVLCELTDKSKDPDEILELQSKIAEIKAGEQQDRIDEALAIPARQAAWRAERQRHAQKLQKMKERIVTAESQVANVEVAVKEYEIKHMNDCELLEQRTLVEIDAREVDQRETYRLAQLRLEEEARVLQEVELELSHIAHYEKEEIRMLRDLSCNVSTDMKESSGLAPMRWVFFSGMLLAWADRETMTEAHLDFANDKRLFRAEGRRHFERRSSEEVLVQEYSEGAEQMQEYLREVGDGILLCGHILEQHTERVQGILALEEEKRVRREDRQRLKDNMVCVEKARLLELEDRLDVLRSLAVPSLEDVRGKKASSVAQRWFILCRLTLEKDTLALSRRDLNADDALESARRWRDCRRMHVAAATSLLERADSAQQAETQLEIDLLTDLASFM